MVAYVAERHSPYATFDPRSETAERDGRSIANIVSIQLVIVVMTQKLALPLGGDIQVASALVIQFIVFGILILKGYLRINPLRTGLVLLFAAYATFMHATYHGSDRYSIGSIFLLVATLSIYCFVIPINRSSYFTILRNFQIVAAVAAGLVFFNWGTQLAGLGIFNLEEYIPTKLMYHYYVYLNKLHWNQPWIKPNGIFFLEVSHLSQFIGMALVIELALFRRIRLIGLYALALLCSFGGTGTLLVVTSLPFLAFMLPRKYLMLGLVAAPILLGTAAVVGVLDNFTNRVDEFGTENTSGYNRFIMPAKTAADALQRDGLEGLLGSGAGTIAAGDRSKRGEGGLAWSAYSKAIFEYGLIGFLIWLTLTTVSIFNRPVPFIVCWVVFIQYNFLNGALAVPLHTVYCYILAAAYVFNDPPRVAAEGESSEPTAERSEPASRSLNADGSPPQTGDLRTMS